MNLSIRMALKEKLQNVTPQELEQTIADAISSNEEQLLPGLGFLFELYWKQSTPEHKAALLKELSTSLQAS